VETGTVEQTDAQAASSVLVEEKIDVVSFPTQTERRRGVVGTGQRGIRGQSDRDTSWPRPRASLSCSAAVNVAPYGIATPKTTRGRAGDGQEAPSNTHCQRTYHAILAKYGVTAGALTSSKSLLTELFLRVTSAHNMATNGDAVQGCPVVTMTVDAAAVAMVWWDVGPSIFSKLPTASSCRVVSGVRSVTH